MVAKLGIGFGCSIEKGAIMYQHRPPEDIRRSQRRMPRLLLALTALMLVPVAFKRGNVFMHSSTG